jgi:hypothetical protein
MEDNRVVGDNGVGSPGKGLFEKLDARVKAKKDRSNAGLGIAQQQAHIIPVLSQRKGSDLFQTGKEMVNLHAHNRISALK